VIRWQNLKEEHVWKRDESDSCEGMKHW